MQPPLPPSIVNGEAVTAYNFRTRQRDRPMNVTNIIRYPPMAGGNIMRYRIQGVDSETNDVMNKFCIGEYVTQVSEQLNIPIRDYDVETP
jgi:hypothetical protein